LALEHVLKEDTAEPHVTKPSLRERLKAWWEGYELETPAAPPAEVGTAAAELADIVDEEDDEPVEPPRPLAWTPQRIAAVQRVWGDGFCGPGGPRETLGLVEVLGLTAEMSMLDLGAGLGGPARTMAEKYGVWVTGMEREPELAEAGMELSTKAGMTRKVPIALYDPEALELPSAKYDCVFAKECLYVVGDKQRLLAEVRKSLKPRGQLLFTDYVLENTGAGSKALRDWIAGEPIQPTAWSLKQFMEALDEIGFHRAITPMDITDEFNARIVKGWETSADVIAKQIRSGRLDRGLIDALVSEAELWMYRSNVLTSGDVKLYRFYASLD
jgi:SAM-dependent methyltransferase